MAGAATASLLNVQTRIHGCAQSNLLDRYQHESHHNAGQGDQPANPVCAVLFGLPHGVHGFFLSHGSPDSE